MSSPRIRILVVEDEGLFRSFMKRWLADHPRFQLVGAVASAEEALPLVSAKRTDLLLVDLQLPGMDGLNFVRAARRARPEVPSLVLSSLMDPLSLTRVRESGVEGYIEKDSPPEMLERAMLAVAAGERYFSARFVEIMGRENAQANALGKVLSRRQQEVMALVVAGKTSREIAEFYNIGQRTVEFHRANLMAKLGVANTAELITLARTRGAAGAAVVG